MLYGTTAMSASEHPLDIYNAEYRYCVSTNAPIISMPLSGNFFTKQDGSTVETNVGVIGELLLEFYTYYLNVASADAAIFMMITLIFLASLFTALGFFDKWVNFARCGLIIPITGFAHSMTSAAIEFKREGFITGLGANIFKLAGTVILYGIVSAYIFSIIRYFILGGI